MRIGIDATSLLYGTGVSFYTGNLLRALSKIDKKDKFVIFGSSLRGKLLLEKRIKNLKLGQNFFLRIASFPPSFLEMLWHRIGFLSIEKIIEPVDVFHAWDWLMPVAKRTKIVATIHDLAVLRFPQFFHSKIVKVQKQRLKLVKKQADAVIAVSKNTKRDIIQFLKIPEEKIYVIYEAVPVEHQMRAGNDDVKKIKRKYGLEKYILCVGTREPRKNLKGAIEAYKTLTSQYSNIKLVIVGKFGWGEDVKKFQIKNSKLKIKFIEEASDKELATLYAGAECFLYPSFYEGFGLPVLEAMHNGCPVITSNVSSLPEIVGNAALLVNPENVAEISQAIKKVVSNKAIGNSLREKGFKQVKKFSWKRTAEKTLEVYKEVLKC